MITKLTRIFENEGYSIFKERNCVTSDQGFDHSFDCYLVYDNDRLICIFSTMLRKTGSSVQLIFKINNIILLTETYMMNILQLGELPRLSVEEITAGNFRYFTYNYNKKTNSFILTNGGQVKVDNIKLVKHTQVHPSKLISTVVSNVDDVISQLSTLI